MGNVLSTLKDNYIFAVIRGKDQNDGYEIAKAAVEGGIKNLELTFSTPNAAQVIKDLVEDYKDDDSVVVGAGTVMTLDLAKEAHEAGAEFLVSPHFSPEIAEYAREVDTYYMPGCGTVTEVVNAMDAGCDIVKVFPGGILGSGFIKDVHGPIPEAQLMPSGGVSLDNIAEWKENGAVSVGVGSALSRDVAEKGYESVTENAKEFVSKLEEEQ
jgi:2-dehydro-3-deoxyphosphogluconate aldolase/(4S)-4-hydroxy-2-oxoglutarate aldolase